MKLKQLMASTLPRARKSRKKTSVTQQSGDPSGQTTLPLDFAKQHDKTSKRATTDAATPRPLAKETCAAQRDLANGSGGVAVYNSLPLNVTLNINVVNKDESGCCTNNNLVDYPQSPLYATDEYYSHYLASPDGIYNTVPRTRSGIRTNPWLPSPRASPATSPAVSATTSPTCPGMTLFFGDESATKSRRFQDVPVALTPYRRHSVEWDTESVSPMQMSITSDIGSSIATTERVESPFSADDDASEKLFSSGNDISTDISLRPECDQAMMDCCKRDLSLESAPGAFEAQATNETESKCPPTDSTSEPDVDLFVKEPVSTALHCDDVAIPENTSPEKQGASSTSDRDTDAGSEVTVDEADVATEPLVLADEDCSNAKDIVPCDSTPENHQLYIRPTQLSPIDRKIKEGEKEPQKACIESDGEQVSRRLVSQTRSLDEIRSSLREKVLRLRREKLLVDEKVRQAQDEDRIRRQEKLRMQRQLTSYRKHVMLRTLHELRAQLERQTERLQETYSDVLDARWTNSCRRSRARARGSDVTRERRHSQ